MERRSSPSAANQAFIAAEARLLGSETQPARQRDDNDSGSRRPDPNEPHPVGRGLRRIRHGAPDGVRKGRKKKALDRESEAEGGDEVAHGTGVTAPCCR